MSVKEYASDVGLSVKVILDLAKRLSINVSSEDDMLDDDAIIILDNEIANNDNLNDDAEESNLDEENTDLDEELEDGLEEDKNDYQNEKQEKKDKFNNFSKKKKSKVSKNNQSNKRDEFKKQRKEMYKHKDKLKSNTVELDSNVVLYKEGMTVGELASALGLGVGEVIKKLMSLGLMMNLNQAIDFDTASIISSDVGRELKKEEATNEVTFEEL